MEGRKPRRAILVAIRSMMHTRLRVGIEFVALGSFQVDGRDVVTAPETPSTSSTSLVLLTLASANS